MSSHTDLDLSADEGPATGSWRQASDVGIPEAREAWARAARPVLVAAARHYRSVVTHRELAAQVQHQTGIRTSQQQHLWLGEVLGPVARECSDLDEPLLSALCVSAQGTVGRGYAGWVRDLRGETPADPDDHAAAERLACYRHFEAVDLPADGGTPALVPMLEMARSRARERSRKAAREAQPVTTCPRCFVAVPASGICDSCS